MVDTGTNDDDDSVVVQSDRGSSECRRFRTLVIAVSTRQVLADSRVIVAVAKRETYGYDSSILISNGKTTGRRVIDSVLIFLVIQRDDSVENDVVAFLDCRSSHNESVTRCMCCLWCPVLPSCQLPWCCCEGFLYYLVHHFIDMQKCRVIK